MATFTAQSKNSATFTAQSKNSASFTAQNKSVTSSTASAGLYLGFGCFTYTGSESLPGGGAYPTWTAQTKS